MDLKTTTAIAAAVMAAISLTVSIFTYYRNSESALLKQRQTESLRVVAGLARISHHLTVEARYRPAITSLRLLAVLNVLSSTPSLVKQRAPRTDGPLTHFASPPGEKSGLEFLHFSG